MPATLPPFVTASRQPNNWLTLRHKFRRAQQWPVSVRARCSETGSRHPPHSRLIALGATRLSGFPCQAVEHGYLARARAGRDWPRARGLMPLPRAPRPGYSSRWRCWTAAASGPPVFALFPAPIALIAPMVQPTRTAVRETWGGIGANPPVFLFSKFSEACGIGAIGAIGAARAITWTLSSGLRLPPSQGQRPRLNHPFFRRAICAVHFRTSTLNIVGLTASSLRRISVRPPAGTGLSRWTASRLPMTLAVVGAYSRPPSGQRNCRTTS